MGTESDFELDFVYQLLALNDPDRDKTLRGHWGEHAAIMTGMIKNPQVLPIFKSILRRLKRNLFKHTTDLRAREGTFPNLSIALMCRSGKHRSVCFTALLKWCLLSEHFTVGDTLHLNDDQWGSKLCTDCSQCKSCPWLKGPIKEDVLQIWRGL